MPIRVCCPGCGKTFQIREELAGKQRTCPAYQAALNTMPPQIAGCQMLSLSLAANMRLVPAFFWLLPILASLLVGKPLAAREIPAPDLPFTVEPCLNTLVGLLGKKIDGQEMQDFRNCLGKKPRVSLYPSCKFHCWNSLGISLRFESDVLVTVFFYAAGADGFDQYQDRLPGDLSFADSMKIIEKKLGKLRDLGGNTDQRYCVSYQGREIGFCFSRGMTHRRDSIYFAYISIKK